MYWDRFDIVEAYYSYYCDYHTGMWSDEYKRVCNILTYFKPSPMFNGYDSLSDNGKEIYNNLVRKFQK